VWAAATGKARLPTVASLTGGTTRRYIIREPLTSEVGCEGGWLLKTSTHERHSSRVDHRTTVYRRVRSTQIRPVHHSVDIIMHRVTVTSQNLWSQYDRHFVGITRHIVWSEKAKIYGVIHIKLNQLVYESVYTIISLQIKRI